MNNNYIDKIFSCFKNLKIGVIGDYCLDLYWDINMTRSSLSNESPFCTFPVVQEKTSLGAAGNVVANLAALCPQKIYAIGVLGSDWRRDIIVEKLAELKCIDNKLIELENYSTPAYCRLLQFGTGETYTESNRIDFINIKPLLKSVEDKIINELDSICPDIDVLVVNDQLRQGLITPKIQRKLNEISKIGMKVVVDSRNNVKSYRNSILKVNKFEGLCAVLNKNNIYQDSLIEYDLDYMDKVAKKLAKETHSIIILTLGKDGVIIAENNHSTYIEAVKITGEIDSCGAGDTFISTFSLCLAADMDVLTAAKISNISSSIILKKIGTTGTATKEEILATLQ